jgi:hypothetical protein
MMEFAGSTLKPNPAPARPACTACKERKVKCDRNSPCSGCLKVGFQFVIRAMEGTFFEQMLTMSLIG